MRRELVRIGGKARAGTECDFTSAARDRSNSLVARALRGPWTSSIICAATHRTG
jgi:hypothetical protein